MKTPWCGPCTWPRALTRRSTTIAPPQHRRGHALVRDWASPIRVQGCFERAVTFHVTAAAALLGELRSIQQRAQARPVRTDCSHYLPDTRNRKGWRSSSRHKPMVVSVISASGSICHHSQSLHNPQSDSAILAPPKVWAMPRDYNVLLIIVLDLICPDCRLRVCKRTPGSRIEMSVCTSYPHASQLESGLCPR